MMHLELLPSPMLEEETSEGAITPRPPQRPRVTHSRVRAGFAGDPYPLPTPSLACAPPMRHFPAWLVASMVAFPRQLGEK